MNGLTPQRRSGDRFLERSHELLLALSRAQSHVVPDGDPRDLFGELLTAVLSLTDSQYGFLGEVVPSSDGTGSLRMHAASDVSWDPLYLGTAFDAAVKTGQLVMFTRAFDAEDDHGSPAITTFLGMPIHHRRELVGVLGIANRRNGYDAATVTYLEPFLITCGLLIEGCRTDERRRRSEQRLRESEERYRRVVETQTELICRFLPDTTLTFVNEPYARYFGRSPDHLIGTPFLSLIPLEAHADVIRQLASFGPAQAVRTYEHEVLLPNGNRGWQEWTDQAIFNESGVLVEFQSVGRDVTDRKHTEDVLRRSETALRESQSELRLLAGRLLSAQEEERSALARELHDDLSQRLAALAIETAMLEVDCRTNPDTAFKRLRDIKDRLVDVSTDVHNISRQLHPAILKDLGLTDAVHSECARFSEREGIQVEFAGKGVPTLPPEVAICLYRIVQEGLRNIAKHAKAKEARVTLFGEDHAVVLAISDSGVGFDPASVRSSGGLGLASMRERTWLVLGDIVVRSKAGEGTTIEVRVPLGEPSS